MAERENNWDLFQLIYTFYLKKWKMILLEIKDIANIVRKLNIWSATFFFVANLTNKTMIMFLI